MLDFTHVRKVRVSDTGSAPSEAGTVIVSGVAKDRLVYVRDAAAECEGLAARSAPPPQAATASRAHEPTVETTD
ncbi:hypothetical protein ACFY0P_44465 [Streptomyces sp. NPDC001714]|uniref:hypothetical protein n=1 Tax=Streptomyces sp. NPDC001714 TaxID=3364603 RepID=UPI0036967504